MIKRVLLAGVLGAVAMFFWTFVAHEILPLGEIGVREIPNEGPVLSAMRLSLGDRGGFYLFPGFGLPETATSQQKQAAMSQYEQKLAANPTGVLIYSPPGTPFAFGRRLTVEFFTEFVQCLLAVTLLAQAHLLRFVARVGFVVLIGVLAAITTNISQWNWYGFPITYTIGYMTTILVGFVWVGWIAAAIIKK